MTISDRIKALLHGHPLDVEVPMPDRSAPMTGEVSPRLNAADVERREGGATTDALSNEEWQPPPLVGMPRATQDEIADRITQALLNRAVAMPGSVDIFGELRQVILEAMHESP